MSDHSDSATEILLDTIGKYLQEEEKKAFGKISIFTPATTYPKQVGAAGPEAPLVDTGNLRDKVARRTSKSKIIKEG